ncbi:hypothetical protein [Rheinheimera aquimaris]|uniref:hypothetical protein n=1 Tax=Rheinheimera aquimaris TaxID=412437 RepID=UPI003A9845EC
MDLIKECGSLCSDPAFISMLNRARGQVGDEVRAANHRGSNNKPATGYDAIRANSPLGLVIRKDKDIGYKYSRVGTNATAGRECIGNNGMVCNFVNISEDDTAVAVLVGVQPRARLESFNSEHFRAVYKKLARETQKPVFVMGTGTNAIGIIYVTDGVSFTRVDMALKTQR